MNGNEPLLYDYSACKTIDKKTIEIGFSEKQLMGQAALASLHSLLNSDIIKSPLNINRIFFLCGSGNNGGDGYALAYMLLAHDIRFQEQIRIFRTNESKTETAAFYAKQLVELGIKLEGLEEFSRTIPGKNDIIIEALLGIGQDSPPRPAMIGFLQIVSKLRAQKKCPKLIALDIPIGLRENGAVRFVPPGLKGDPDLDIFPAPDEIHSYGVEKGALRLNPDLAAFSSIKVLPMGFNPAAMSSNEHRIHLMEPNNQTARIFQKSHIEHKYSAGHALIIGGSPGMEGAVLMAANSFFASGGGILHICLPGSTDRIGLTALQPAIMFLDNEIFIPEHLLPAAICIGPGLGELDFQNMENRIIGWLQTLHDKYKNKKKDLPTILLDAGALGLVYNQGYPDILKKRTIITPHHGEWQKMGGTPATHLEALYSAMKWNQEKIGTWTLLKGPVTIFIENELRAAINPNPNPSLAVAGTGDNLAGIMLALFARKRDEEVSYYTLVKAALWLLDQTGRKMKHPIADSFPELIREVLSSSR